MSEGDEILALPAEALGHAPGRDRLAGRRILVVGAGTQGGGDPDQPIGNGQAIARLAAIEGAMVACADIDDASAKRTADAISLLDGDAFTIVGDVTDAEDCARIVAQAGLIDGLVCNVGIGRGMGLRGTTVADWDTTFAVNLRSHFLLAQAALPDMAPGGSIVFISSIAGLTAGSRIPAYDASKAGLLGLCRQVAAEGARRGLRANVVFPGLIDTPLGRLATQGRPSRAKAPVPMGRQGTAWEVAYATVFLLSDESSYITGQRLIVDGGMTMH